MSSPRAPPGGERVGSGDETRGKGERKDSGKPPKSQLLFFFVFFYFYFFELVPKTFATMMFTIVSIQANKQHVHAQCSSTTLQLAEAHLKS